MNLRNWKKKKELKNKYRNCKIKDLPSFHFKLINMNRK